MARHLRTAKPASTSPALDAFPTPVLISRVLSDPAHSPFRSSICQSGQEGTYTDAGGHLCKKTSEFTRPISRANPCISARPPLLRFPRARESGHPVDPIVKQAVRRNWRAVIVRCQRLHVSCCSPRTSNWLVAPPGTAGQLPCSLLRLRFLRKLPRPILCSSNGYTT